MVRIPILETCTSQGKLGKQNELKKHKKNNSSQRQPTFKHEKLDSEDEVVFHLGLKRYENSNVLRTLFYR